MYWEVLPDLSCLVTIKIGCSPDYFHVSGNDLILITRKAIEFLSLTVGLLDITMKQAIGNKFLPPHQSPMDSSPVAGTSSSQVIDSGKFTAFKENLNPPQRVCNYGLAL